jgi:hypothetical protein
MTYLVVVGEDWARRCAPTQVEISERLRRNLLNFQTDALLSKFACFSEVRIHPSSAVCLNSSTLETPKDVVAGFHANLSTVIDG